MKAAFLTLTLIFTFTALVGQNNTPSFQSMLFMEDEIQNVNEDQKMKGDGFYSDVKNSLSYHEMNPKDKIGIQRYKNVLNRLDSLEIVFTQMIALIDNEKYKLIQSANEDTSNLIVSYGENSKPTRFNLFRLKSPGANARIMDSAELLISIITFREDLISLISNYKWGENSYTLKTFNPYEYNGNIHQQIDEYLLQSSYNKEDKWILKDIFSVVNETFFKLMKLRSGNLQENLSLLSVVQKDILSCRILTYGHWKSKISTGEYGFNKIVGIVDGPTELKVGENGEYNILFAGIHTAQESELIITSPKNVKAIKNEDGTYRIEFSTQQTGEILLKGFFKTTNLSGLTNTSEWSKKVVISE